MPEDTVLLASNSVDVHGRFGPMSNEYVTIKDGEYYGIPYRSLLPLNIGNLLVAGRCISASSEAAGAIRVMPPCMGTGQAAGTAAALAALNDCSAQEVEIKSLQRVLKEDGVYI